MYSAQGPAPEPRRQPAVGKQENHHDEQDQAGGPHLVKDKPYWPEREAVPEAVDKVGVVRASVADEQADGRREEKPAERVSRQAAGDEEPDRRARDADHHRHDPVAELTGHHGQRDIHRQEQRGQATGPRRPGRWRPRAEAARFSLARRPGASRVPVVHEARLRRQRSGNVTAQRRAGRADPV
jgi:hypothetical protein